MTAGKYNHESVMKTKCTLVQIYLMSTLLLMLPAVVQAQFSYTTNNGTITITGYNGGGAITIPSTLNGYPVTSIGPEAFYDSSLTSVTIGTNITSIGDGAFEDSVLLTAITVNSGNPAYSSVSGILFNKSQTTLIEYPASKNGASYFSYTIPNSVTNIGDGAFDGCGFLNSVTIGTNVTSIGASAFFLTSLSSITIPSSVANIGQYAFEDCALLTSIYFKGNAPAYGVYSFETHTVTTAYYYAGTSGWGSSINGVGYNIPTVMLNAPNQAGSLQVSIAPAGAITSGAQWQVDGGVLQPSGATVLGLSVGNHTVSYTTVSGWTTPSNQTVSVSANSTATTNGTYFTSQAQFSYITNNGSITITSYTGVGGDVSIPSKINSLPVTSIGYGAFAGTSLTSITIPNIVTNIGGSAFEGCFNLAAITVDSGNPAYSSVTGVLFNKSETLLVEYPGGIRGSYTIPTTVTSIGDSAFWYCTNLTSVTIPTTVTSIENYAFGATSLTSVAIPNSVTSIGYNAFRDTSLTSVIIPTNVINIGEGAFFRCFSLTAINVNPGNPAYSSVAGVLFNIGQTTLVEYPAGIGGGYTIPITVTSIGEQAFYETSLTSIAIPNGVTNIGDYAFADCFSLTSALIPGTVTNIGAWAFSVCPGLTNVTIPSSVTNLGGYAFAYCSSLMAIYFQGNAPTPTNDLSVFESDNKTTVYYLLGTTGWGSMFDGLPTALWNSQTKLQVATTSLPNGTQGTFYNQTLTASGGQTPYSWTNISGVLPLGLTLAQDGTISGTPTVTGTSNFTVRVTDSLSATATQALSLTIGVSQVLTLGNADFSTPALGAGVFFQSDPPTGPGQPWTFTGQSGVANDLGSACCSFSVSNPSYSGQYAYIQLAGGNSGSMSQVVTFPSIGTYSVSFLAAGRVAYSAGSGGNLNYTVKVAPYAGGLSILNVTNASASSQPFTNVTYQFIISVPGNYIISFAALSGYGPYTDNTALIDNVSLAYIASAPMLQPGQLANGQFMLTWSAVSNGVYQLQYKTNLNQTNWINIGSTITASNTVLSVTNAIGSDKQRFYRIQQQ